MPGISSVASLTIFITGTDTGVGKTVLSCALVAALVQRGLRVAVFKPVETGCEFAADGNLIAQDALLLQRFANISQSIAEICPNKFHAPAAPLVAARLEGKEISVSDIVNGVAAVSARADVVVIEGAGGALVPITGNVTFADLAASCSWSTVVVVGSKLGALSHASLTFESLQARRVEILGYVVNDIMGGPGPSNSYESTAHRTNREKQG